MRGALALSLTDLIVPPRCWGCGAVGAEDGLFCEGCAGKVRMLRGADCLRCGRFLGEHRRPRPCGDCRRGRPYRRAVAWAVYEGPVREALHALKFQEVEGLARLIADRLLERVRAEPFAARLDAVTTVPQTLGRLLKPVHPAVWIGRRIAAGLGRPWRPGLLRRIRGGPPQRDLGNVERRKNVTGAFEGTAAAAGLRVLLVDDVMTTGATAEACAAALREAGARGVWIAAAGRS
ncbi:MAG: ComF family protein [Planctomycetes bacterium]|nr:ComF family protein [Planctomycetota bacterium]